MPRWWDVLKPQAHLHFENYMTEGDWDALRNRALIVPSKLDVVVSRAEKIGLLSLTEKTAASIASIVLVTHGATCTPSQCYETVNMLKEKIRVMRMRRKPTTVPSLSTFADDAKEFLSGRPGMYEHGDEPSLHGQCTQFAGHEKGVRWGPRTGVQPCTQTDLSAIGTGERCEGP